ncbi:restriction endonuclease subunit R [Corynebacterium glutamicum]|nr:restriction endonuclease subunit R [Corynebacterium glutamicum]
MRGDRILAFIRHLVGLDESAVREEFADLIRGSTLSTNQNSFIKKIEKGLIKRGYLEFSDLFQESFTIY